MAESNQYLVFGLNPTSSSYLIFHKLAFGNVNRAHNAGKYVGGKGNNYNLSNLSDSLNIITDLTVFCVLIGQNFAKACWKFAKSSKLGLVQIIGGQSGENVSKMLTDIGIKQYSYITKGVTRQTTTLLDENTGEMTELIEPSSVIPRSEREEFENWLKTSVISPEIKGIAMCGTFPPGLSPNTYELIAKCVPRSETTHPTIFVDAIIDIDCLRSGKFEGDTENLPELAIEVANEFKIPIVALTNGPNGAVLVDFRTATPIGSSYKIPDLDSFLTEYPHFANPIGNMRINPIGAGDTCSANAVEAYRKGLAAACASCLVLDQAGYFDINAMEKILEFVTVSTSEL
ncbi:hypothetical protein HK098_005448 [Nowakowskiella sp. JEL0407]|nr:hypothetical protein HK098_005448 [Nowakowskiella sp. JEL0407]